MHGIPVLIKDANETADMPTSYGSMAMVGFESGSDAVAVERLRKAGMIVIGKTNSPEFGLRPTTSNGEWGPTRNPWDTSRTAGGSSGGAAAALALGMVPVAQGSDGGGSCRIPASCCGVVGLKPTLGTVPHGQPPDLFGTVSYVGPMTRTVADAALMLAVMAGPDEADPHSLGRTPDDYLGAATAGRLDGLRIAWMPTVGNRAVDREVKALCEQAVRRLERAGAYAEAAEVDLTPCEAIFLTLSRATNFSRFGDRLPEWRDRLDASLVDSIEKGRDLTAADLARAVFARSDVYRQVQALFRRYDLLATPTRSAPPPPAGRSALEPIEVEGKPAGSLRGAWYPYTLPFNQTGHPAISVPAGFTASGLPVGLHLVAPWHQEVRLLRAAALLEAEAPWAHRRPPVP
ncbi:MAG TPA: amidase family protein [Thermodesulfobacteriota bacterium]